MSRATVRVGLVGTGYAARLRADALQAEPRSQLVAVAGHDHDRTTDFSSPYGAEVVPWVELVQRDDIDLVIVATVNRDHGPIAKAAVAHGKAVVVEYPLALDLQEAIAIVAAARQQGTLLHVEHIELLSGIHHTIQSGLPEIGTPFYVRYVSMAPKRPAPKRWSYSPALFGFPLVGALSRVHRLIDLFGEVKTVVCNLQMWSSDGDVVAPDSAAVFGTVLCSAQLRFASGLLAEVVYGKGQALWDAQRRFEAQGSLGRLRVDREGGELQLDKETRHLAIGSRRGLFAQDTAMVLDALLQPTQSSLYVTAEQSLYALRVADAARRSAIAGQVISLLETKTVLR
ncbi:MAG: Gfo/Idh/MocA family oxidoreductase [Elainellaceae cyanobacterium]